LITSPVSLEFDRNQEWCPRLSAALEGLIPLHMAEIIRESQLQYFEDAAQTVLSRTNKQVLSASIIDWITSQDVIAYHGTRLTKDDHDSIQVSGLLPLVAAQRTSRLERALSSHPRWLEVRDNLPKALELFGSRQWCGAREQQVHLTLSRAGLVSGFNHYLAQGSEFDWHVSEYLLGSEGQALIALDGAPYLVTASLPGKSAFAACNRFGTFAEDLPNLVRQLLHVWSYWLSDSAFDARQLKLDCGLVFSEAIPASRIKSIEPWSQA
jgi:hypothetical protein